MVNKHGSHRSKKHKIHTYNYDADRPGTSNTVDNDFLRRKMDGRGRWKTLPIITMYTLGVYHNTKYFLGFLMEIFLFGFHSEKTFHKPYNCDNIYRHWSLEQYWYVEKPECILPHYLLNLLLTLLCILVSNKSDQFV